MLQNITETLDYIYSFVNHESNLNSKYFNKDYSLLGITNLLNHFDNPHLNKQIIHIAGTKGKGSTSFMVSKLLMEIGFDVATFVSPHLLRPNERILFNLTEIGDNDLIEITNYIKIILEKYSLRPTTFELFFLIYLLYGDKNRANYFVVEVGLGGRLDCTNIVTPAVSVITSIGYDHTDILGDSIKKIAKEKGGIIKEETNVVIGRQYYNCKNIFKNIAKKVDSNFFDIDNHFKVTNLKPNDIGITFNIFFKDEKVLISNFYLPLFGKHQIWNFLLAFYTVYLVNKDIVKILLDKRRVDIELKGRVSLICNNPYIVVDVSHNRESAIQLVKTLKFHFKNKRWHVLLGLASDKDVKSFIKNITKIAKSITVTNLALYKKSNPENIFKIAKKHIKNSKLILEPKEAFESLMSKDEDILVTGSFYLSGPFYDFFYQCGDTF